MKSTKLSLQDTLPLTCSRSGTCCHGNRVLLNPWELFRLASEKKIAVKEFRDLYTDLSGIQLRFDGTSQWKGKSACSQYVEGFGCSVHVVRPLACCLFPLGRQIQNNEVQYIHEGKQFPCLEDCPIVEELPQMSVGEYLQGQKTELFEQAQDAYLELMQDLADLAFEFFLDTGLAATGDTKTLAVWNEIGNESAESLSVRLGPIWMDRLMIPTISQNVIHLTDPIAYIQKHAETLQRDIQESFGVATSNEEFQSASILIMGLALQLARAIGADPKSLAEQWCDVAKGFGASNPNVN